ncbi:uncharacterized protein LOC118267931 [Spodoptera frugiperda]|uniref:Uncharacterized protein LOC118267931 n=1 Tax=Spodoptera frugiperda TaxID=7108 RepID=A0A9R0EVT2_SPOFR|nr:uncharacterized protein LOC118267931 [Spodoptera frugiperda]
MVSKIFIVALIVGTVSAATSRAKLPEKPSELAHKEGCYIKQINDVIPFGTTISAPGACTRISCGSTMINYATCGIVATDDPKCHVTEKDLSKPYPDCCPTVECDVDNNLV